MSLRTKTLLLFLGFVLVPLGAVGFVASIGTRVAVEQALRSAAEAGAPALQAPRRDPVGVEAVGGRVPGDQRRALRRAKAGTQTGRPSTDEVLAPLARVWMAYGVFVLLVGVAAAFGFRLVSNRIFRSLDEFRSAVEQIARGDFAPWLPLPGRDEVGWLSVSLGRMAERMGRMMQTVEQGGRLAVVGEMAAQMAHEVRTPLSSIKMNLQMLARGAERGMDPAGARVSVETSLREIARLEATVNRFLELGAPSAGLRHRCSLHALINEVVTLVQGGMTRAGIDLRVDLEAESDAVLADSDALKGVLLNLLVNARDALPAGGEISAETQLFLGEGGSQMVAVAVNDTGAGVPPALREDIFHPFFTTKANGSGIGLPAALRTLREHGGDLYLGQRPDGRSGGCFVAVLPLAPPSLEDGVRPALSRRRSATNGVTAGALSPRWSRLSANAEELPSVIALPPPTQTAPPN